MIVSNFFYDIRGNKDTSLYLQGSVKENFLQKDLRLPTLPMSGNVLEVIGRLDTSHLGLDKTFAPSFRILPYRLLTPAAFEIWVAFKIARIFDKVFYNFFSK